METVKKVFLTLFVLGIAVWFLKEPNKQIEKIISPRFDAEVGLLKFESDREGFINFNGEQMLYEKNIVDKLPIDLLREFKSDADYRAKEKAKVQKHGDKYFAWYVNKMNETRGLIVYPYKEGSSIVFNLIPTSKEKKMIMAGVPLPDEMKQIMVLNTDIKNGRSISIYKSPWSVVAIKNWFLEALNEKGWQNAGEIIKRENIENFDAFTHEKKKCFIQYEEKDSATIVTIVVES